MDKILISACLLGEHCRYDGKDCKNPLVEELNRYFDLVPFCPEVEGGLPTPRLPSEIKAGRVYSKDGTNVTKQYNLGAEKALRLCKLLNIHIAILKDKSPACGVYQIHDGSFSGKLKKGMGVTAALLSSIDYWVMSEDDLPEFIEMQKRKRAIVEERTAEIKAKEAAKENGEEPASEEEYHHPTWKRKERSYERNADYQRKKYGQRDFQKDGEKTDSQEGGSYERKPRNYGDKPHFKKERPYGDKPYLKKERSYGDRPYKKDFRRDGDRPYSKEEGSYQRKPREYGDKSYSSESKSYERKPRSYGDKPYFKKDRSYGDRPYFKKERSFGDKPYKKDFHRDGDKPYSKEGGSYDRKPRNYSDKPYFKKDHSYGDKPYKKSYSKEGGNSFHGGGYKKPRPGYGDRKYGYKSSKPFKKDGGNEGD